MSVRQRHVNISRIPAREPATATFCAISLAVFVAALFVPTIGGLLLLYPPLAVSNGYLWQFLTYAFFPVGILNLLTVTGFLLWFGWHLEPRLGWRRLALIFVLTAVAGGLGYALLTPTPAPLGGGAFVASGLGAVFLMWTVFNRSIAGWPYRIFWLFAACYVLLVFLASPLHLIVPNLAVWAVAVPVAHRFVRRAAA